MQSNYDKEEILEALRELTKLGPIDQLKIKRAYYQNKKNKEGYYVSETDLELQLRMVDLAKSLTPLWKKYVAVGEYSSGLSDYVRDYLNGYIDDKKKENPTKTIK